MTRRPGMGLLGASQNFRAPKLASDLERDVARWKALYGELNLSLRAANARIRELEQLLLDAKKEGSMTTNRGQPDPVVTTGRRREPPKALLYLSGEHRVEQSMSLLDICAAIHADNHGIADPLTADRRAELIDYLRHRVEVWTPSLERSETYDNIVRALSYVTIAEKHWSEP